MNFDEIFFSLTMPGASGNGYEKGQPAHYKILPDEHGIREEVPVPESEVVSITLMGDATVQIILKNGEQIVYSGVPFKAMNKPKI